MEERSEYVMIGRRDGYEKPGMGEHKVIRRGVRSYIQGSMI